MGGVFLNYRTGDGDWAAALVKRELSRQFGAANVFYAGQSIRPGEDFSLRILGRLRQCEVLLAMIGPRWLTAVDRMGDRRIDNPDDWVRREIGEAFQVGLRVIPVLLDDIDRLDKTTLPDAIAQLARCQYLRMHHRSDDLDLTRLVDELVELVPDLITTWRHETMPGSGTLSRQSINNADDELRSTVTRLREALTNSTGHGAVQHLLQVTAGRALEMLAAYDPASPRHVDDNDIPAVLAERLSSYERDLAPLLRLVAVGTCAGDREHDDLWITVVKRFLDRRDQPARSSEQEFSAAVEAYPSLLLTYVVGVAGMAAGREDLVYRLLERTTTRGMPVIRALALRHVVDPRHAAALAKWDGKPPHQALSVHLRQVLGATFFNVIRDADYESSFADYEYLRSLLEFHHGPFSSLGEFAVALARGDSTVHRRMAPRLSAESILLRSGAFDSDPCQVSAARRRLKRSVHGRYR